MIDAVCSRAFRGHALQDHITKDRVLEALREEADMLDKAPSAIKLKTVIKDIIWMEPAMTVVEGSHDVKMGVVDIMKKVDGDRLRGSAFNLCSGVDALQYNLC